MDTTAIRDVIAASDELQNDADGFASLLTDDVALVNIAGRRLTGRENVRAAYHQALATPLAQVGTRLEITDVWLLRPDVAMASVIKHVSDPAETAPRQGSTTFVLTEAGGTWRIASIQTTPIR
jgi:uncharacterized protein (TIGR02246 family)